MNDRLIDHRQVLRAVGLLLLVAGCSDERTLDAAAPSPLSPRWWPSRAEHDGGRASDDQPASCDETACSERAATTTQHLRRWGVSVQTCCLAESVCGLTVDPDAPVVRPAAASIVADLKARGCGDADELLGVAASYDALAGAIFEGPPLVAQDGGVVLPDGGVIVLDPHCPDLAGDTGLFAFRYPGCCLPEGQCGNSNHTAPGLAAAGEPLRCLGFDELANVRSEFIPVPEQPTDCASPGLR